MTIKELSMTNYRAVDLFAGGGGLTVGLKHAGFKVIAAIELEKHAFSTYKRNHPEVCCFHGDIRQLTADDLRAAAQREEIHMIAGCPPCQGFTSLTSKYRRDDERNFLIHDMLRLVLEVRPKAVMLENVPRLAIKGKELFEHFVRELEAAGYQCAHRVLEAADFGVPQARRRLVLVAGLGFAISLPEPTHSRCGRDGKPKWVPVRTVLSGLGRAVTLQKANACEGPQSRNWHVVRNLSEDNQRRLRMAQPGRSWREIPEELRPKCHKGDYKGFSNVYGRMKGNSVSPTITGGCTTLSKGRFGHPTAQRTISVREAARIQTFPDDFVFETEFMDKACEIIGNAFPCLFAQRIAEACKKALDADALARQEGDGGCARSAVP